MLPPLATTAIEEQDRRKLETKSNAFCCTCRRAKLGERRVRDETHTHTYILTRATVLPLLYKLANYLNFLPRQANLFIHPPLPSYSDPLTVTIASQLVKSTNCSKQYNRIEVRSFDIEHYNLNRRGGSRKVLLGQIRR
jgi:hypothetical protein